MSLVRRGEVVYPAYEIHRHSVIYRTPEEMNELLNLLDFQLKLEHSLNAKQYDLAWQIFEPRQSYLLDLITNRSHRRGDLPSFLRRFSAPYRAFRSLLIGIDILERRRKYLEAVSLMRDLLSITKSPHDTSNTCPLDALGPCRSVFLLTRLLVDEGTHLKRALSAYTTVCEFLGIREDKSAVECCRCLRAGARLSVQEQLTRIVDFLNHRNHLSNDREPTKAKRKRLDHTAACDKPLENDSFQTHEHSRSVPNLLPDFMQAPKVEVCAFVTGSSNDIGSHRPHYLWTEAGSSDEGKHSPPTTSIEPLENQSMEQHTLLLTVEQWALQHYTKILGFKYGVHSESRAFHLLFTLLFYDILFDHALPDVFYSYRQSAPLDLFSDDFYKSRRQHVDKRLAWIMNSSKTIGDGSTSLDAVQNRIGDCWEAHHGERCLWVDWDMFNGPQAVIDLFWCLGPPVVHAVCRQLATDFRSWRSGLPDLIVWTPDVCRAKIVEVKGPGDRLSTQQVVWLDILMRAGADVEICNVSAISHRSLSTRS